MRITVTLACLLVLTPGAASLVSAQTDEVRAAVLRELILPATADPTGSRAPIEPISTATLVTGTGGSVTGKFQLGFKLDDVNYVHATFATPAKDGKAALVLGDELPSGNKVTLAYSRVINLDITIETQVQEGTDLATMTRAVNRSEADDNRARVFAAAATDALTTKPAVVITGTYDYGRETFTYRETDAGPDLEPQLRESTGGGVAAGVLFRPTGSTSATYVGMSLKFGTTWKAVTPKTRCNPISGSETLDCADVVIGPPTKTEKSSLSVELRQKLLRTFGWTPMLSYDFADAAAGKRLTFDVPLYLVTDKPKGEGNLTGGVAVGWREGSGAYAAVFVGPQFSIPGIQ